MALRGGVGAGDSDGTIALDWGALMRFSKPSPSMIVALIALALSMTGTGLAASGVIITRSSQIKDGTITAAKIKPGSITAAQIKTGTITAAKIKPGTITSNELGDGSVTLAKMFPKGTKLRLAGPGDYPQICPSGEIILGTAQCPDYSITEQGRAAALQALAASAIAQNKADTASTAATAAQTSADAANAAVTKVPVPVSSYAAIADLPFYANNALPFAQDFIVAAEGNPATMSATQAGFTKVATPTPAVPETMTNAYVAITSVPSANIAAVDVTFFVGPAGGTAAPKGSCEIAPATPGGTLSQGASCKIAGPVAVPAGSQICWEVHQIDVPGGSVGDMIIALAPVLAGTAG